MMQACVIAEDSIINTLEICLRHWSNLTKVCFIISQQKNQVNMLRTLSFT